MLKFASMKVFTLLLVFYFCLFSVISTIEILYKTIRTEHSVCENLCCTKEKNNSLPCGNPICDSLNCCCMTYFFQQNESLKLYSFKAIAILNIFDTFFVISNYTSRHFNPPEIAIFNSFRI